MQYFKRRWVRYGLVGLLLAGVTLALAYRYLINGGMIARQEPSSVESYVARRLLNISIPDDAKKSPNPLSLSPSGPDAAAGRDLYMQSCAVCHAHDGAGKTAAGGGLYPPAPDLRSPDTARRSDGELFYLIRNGIRNTGMPGWQLSDLQTWQLVVHLRALPKTVAPTATAVAFDPGKFVGSASCRSCHTEIYDRWKTTLMANVVRDPKEHPDAIIPDLSKSDPLVNFSKDDIAFVYGSKWKQRYFKKVGDDYFPFPAQWDVTHKKWKKYFVEDDWWAQHYPPDNFQRPTSALCDGCHSVNFDIKTKTVTEWNVGCEKCHGAGGAHLLNPVNATILNPARMDYVSAADTCMQCHTQGQPLNNPIDGKYYDWPVGFVVGGKLNEYWKLQEHKLGATSFSHFGDGTAIKNRMQGNDYVSSAMYTHGVSCHTCHDSHGTAHGGLLRKPGNALCLDCHAPKAQNGPKAASIELHTHHKADSAGSECVACHMPKIAKTLGDVNVRSHTFRFVSPAKTDALKIPNACNVCHADKSTTWTADALKNWNELSPWRMRE